MNLNKHVTATLSPVGVTGHSCFCSIGSDSHEVFEAVTAGRHGITSYDLQELVPDNEGYRSSSDKIAVSRFTEEQQTLLKALQVGSQESIFNKICIKVATDALQNAQVDPSSADCLFILSSTKGDIDSLRRGNPSGADLLLAARIISGHFKNPNDPLVISNACISGALALQTAKRLLNGRQYKNIVVIGADVLSPFVIAGFHSFHALSDTPCRPFDKDRNGLNLGEAAACMVLSSIHSETPALALLAGGASTNDANHISGPSRTGAELSLAIQRAMSKAEVTSEDIGFLSAHGTATLYNDEMEAKAFYLSGLEQVPLHSLKSFIGHSLGAAGIIESVIACMGMANNQVLPSLNYTHVGVSHALRVATEVQTMPINYIVKTASGFGGCNAALVWKKATGNG